MTGFTVPPQTAPTKTVMLGLDAGDLHFIQAHRTHLPVLRRFLEDGELCPLDTTSRLLTGSVWPTFYTGQLPGVHGIYHHLQWDQDQMRIRRVADDWLYAEPFWYALARRGVRVTTVDVPMLFPSRLEAGVEVVNWGSHDQLGPFHCNDPRLARDIERRFGAHPMGAEIPVNKSGTQLERIRRSLIAGAERKGALLEHLIRETNWDFFLGVFGELHRGGHILWPRPDVGAALGPQALLEVYQAVDAALGRVLAAIDTTQVRVLLFSLHGMEANRSQEHLVMPAMQRINLGAGRGEAGTGARGRGQRSLMRVLRNRLPAHLQNSIAQIVPVGVRDWVVSRATSGGYDWPQTPAFALLADYNGYLRFNLRGRELHGCLDAGKPRHREYQAHLAAALCGLMASESQALVDDLIAAADVFPGARSHRLPDLIVTWAPDAPVSTARSTALGEISGQLDTGRSGNHRHEGFIAVHEPVDGGPAWASVRHIADIAPALVAAHQLRPNP